MPDLMNFVKNTKCNCYSEIGKRFYGQSLRDVAMLQRVYLVHLEPLFRSLLFNFCASERTLSLFPTTTVSDRFYPKMNRPFSNIQYVLILSTKKRTTFTTSFIIKTHKQGCDVVTKKLTHTICIQTKKLTLSA